MKTIKLIWGVVIGTGKGAVLGFSIFLITALPLAIWDSVHTAHSYSYIDLKTDPVERLISFCLLIVRYACFACPLLGGYMGYLRSVRPGLSMVIERILRGMSFGYGTGLMLTLCLCIPGNIYFPDTIQLHPLYVGVAIQVFVAGCATFGGYIGYKNVDLSERDLTPRFITPHLFSVLKGICVGFVAGFITLALLLFTWKHFSGEPDPRFVFDQPAMNLATVVGCMVLGGYLGHRKSIHRALK